MVSFIKHVILPFHEKVTKRLLRTFYDRLVNHPLVLVDVGVANDTLPVFSLFKKCVKTVGFEPNKESYEKLMLSRNSNTLFLPMALSDKRGKADFYITKKPEASSLLQSDTQLLRDFPGTDRFEVAQTVRLKVTTLDHALISNNITDIDFIKLDTQGNELNILQHGTESLASNFGVQVEVEFYPVYKGQFVFSDVDRFLRGQGYLLFDLQPSYWKRTFGLAYGKSKGQLIWADALYFKDLKAFFSHLQPMDDHAKFLKSLKAVLILSSYGYADYALECTRRLKAVIRDSSILRDITKIEKVLQKKHFSQFFQKIPFRRKIAALSYHFYKALRSDSKNSIIREKDLGNV